MRLFARFMMKKRLQENEPLVSVVMPCYNDGPYIEEAVDSLRKQTWTNLELVIIDDGSDEETVQMIEQTPFPRKKILHTSHIGPAAARNKGISEAEGGFILPLDADDTIDETYIQKAMAVMMANSNAGIVYCRADLFGEAKGLWDLPDYSLKTELLDNCIFVTAIFRKEDWEKVGGFCEEFRAGMEDYDFWLSLIEMGREVYQLQEVLFHYRIKTVSRTSRFQNSYADKQETYVQLYWRHRELYRQNMDIYCLELRRCLIDQLMLNRQLQEDRKEETERLLLQAKEGQRNLESMLQDPVIEYVASIRKMKPGLSAFLEKLLRIKNNAKRILRRK